MNPLSKRSLLFFALLLILYRADAQKVHFSEIRSLYSADSAGFRNACKADGFGKIKFRDYDSSYILSCYADTGKTGLMRSFGKYVDASGRRSFILSYFLGFDEEGFKLLEKEIKTSGFLSRNTRTTNLPGNYSVEENIYEKDPETVGLHTQYRNGTITGYSIDFFRRGQKSN